MAISDLTKERHTDAYPDGYSDLFGTIRVRLEHFS
jgi:hypothetical protein